MVKQARKNVEPKLGDGEYTLSDGAAWFTVGGFSVHLYSDERGVECSVYQLGRENEPRLAECAAYADQLKPVAVIDLHEYRASRRSQPPRDLGVPQFAQPPKPARSRTAKGRK